ncbi:MAG: DNA-protecting protein DprA [Anaerolineaceae bacterium]|nr:DNA-protecting protein DprA [Anaerolineaceae bacterium]
MMISFDSKVTLLLGSRLAIRKDSDLTPLTLREWNILEKKLSASGLDSPGDLLGLGVNDIQQHLDIRDEEAVRISELLDRIELLELSLAYYADKGIQVVTRNEEIYPQRFRERLKDSAPVVLFLAGEPALMGQPGIAVVGSRHLDPIGQACAEFVGNTCGLSGLVLYSGGAKGVDSISTQAALDARGSAVSVLVHSLEQTIKESTTKRAVERGDLCLVTPYTPDAGFSVGTAMGRNRLIYCLADYAIVVASDAEKGGTWAGATETLKAAWVPVFILNHPDMPDGNRLLLQKGGVPFPHPFPEHFSKLESWLKEKSQPASPKPQQLGLL